MATNLYGFDCQVYPFTYSGSDITNESSVTAEKVKNIITNGTPFDYYIAMPGTTESEWNSLPSVFNLFNKPVGTLPSEFNQVNATKLDSAISQWQLSPMLYYVDANYTGKVSVDECKGLWANRLDMTPYIDEPDFAGFVFVKDQWAYVMLRNYRESTPLKYLNTGIIVNTDTNQVTISRSGIVGQLIFDSTYVKCVITAFSTNNVSARTKRYDTLSYATNDMQNSMHVFNKGETNTLPTGFFALFAAGYIPPDIDEDEDPYAEGGDSDVGGGEGDFDGTGDTIGHPGLPTLSAVDAGFIRLYNPSIAQLNALADYMWSGPFDLSTFKKIFADPMDCILGLSIVPVAVPNGGTAQVTVGNVPTGVSMTLAASQYVQVNCGSLNVKEYWGAYLDYSPYTKAEIYLPYIGFHAIDVDDIMKHNVSVQYNVDILTGACTATVKCGDHVAYNFNGHCAASVPVTGNDWTNVLNGVMTVAGSIGSMVASGGMTAPMAAGTIASAVVNNTKPAIERSGALSGPGGMLGIQTPYLILTRPRQAKPKNQNSYLGYPAFITVTMEDLKGYAEMEEIHLENIHATLEELQEIETLLKTGVIF